MVVGRGVVGQPLQICRGSIRVVNVGEGGGIFALDRATGQFLWANPFPYDAPNFLISNIDGKTGKTTINWDVVLKKRERCVFTATLFDFTSRP